MMPPEIVVKKLGSAQKDLLFMMYRPTLGNEPGVWHPNCGWVKDTFSGTIRVLESLRRRRCVEREDEGSLAPRYVLTARGRQVAKRI